MPESSEGKVLGHVLHSRNPEASATFLEGLLGWTHLDVHLLEPEDRGRSTWFPVIGVANVEETLVRVSERGGGVVRAAYALEGVRRAARIADPIGAHLLVAQFEAPLSASTGATPALAGFPWSELVCADPAGIVGFYEQLFGWRVTESETGGLRVYRFHREERALGSAISDPGLAGGVPAWVGYAFIRDLDARCACARELRGRVTRGPVEVTGHGRFAVVADPADAFLALWEAG